MFRQTVQSHLSETLRWSGAQTVGLPEILAAAVGMAVPLLLGPLAGYPTAGLVAALGSLTVGGLSAGTGLIAFLRQGAVILVLAGLAALLVLTISGHGGLSDILFIALAVTVAALGGLGPRLDRASSYVLLIMAVVNIVPSPPPGRGAAFLALILIGAVWTLALALVFRAAIPKRGNSLPGAAPEGPRSETGEADGLSITRAFDDWSYPIRLGAGLAVAGLANHLWPGHHLQWIGLTVVMLMARHAEPVPIKTTQRALGTAIGVVFTGILFRTSLPATALAAVVGILAGARVFFRDRNYLAYSAVMTPLIVLIIDAGRPLDWQLLLDRLVATMAGALIVVAANQLFGKVLSHAGDAA